MKHPHPLKLAQIQRRDSSKLVSTVAVLSVPPLGCFVKLEMLAKLAPIAKLGSVFLTHASRALTQKRMETKQMLTVVVQPAAHVHWENLVRRVLTVRAILVSMEHVLAVATGFVMVQKPM